MQECIVGPRNPHLRLAESEYEMSDMKLNVSVDELAYALAKLRYQDARMESEWRMLLPMARRMKAANALYEALADLKAEFDTSTHPHELWLKAGAALTLADGKEVGK